jgi:hypothetical protein
VVEQAFSATTATVATTNAVKRAATLRFRPFFGLM